MFKYCEETVFILYKTICIICGLFCGLVFNQNAYILKMFKTINLSTFKSQLNNKLSTYKNMVFNLLNFIYPQFLYTPTNITIIINKGKE